MGLFSRYLIAKFLGLFILALGCSVVIFLVIDFVENTRSWLNHSQQDVIEYYINYIPHIVYLISPIAIIIASIFSVGLMSKNLEIIIMRCSGRSNFSILLPLVVMGIALSAGMYYFGDSILPDSNYRRFKIKEPQTAENQTGNPNEKYKYVYIGTGGYTFLMQYYSGNRQLGNRISILKEQADSLVTRWDAQKLDWENHWVLKNGVKRTLGKDRITAEKFTRLDLLEIEDSPADLINTRVFPDEMRRETLKKRIAVLKRTGEPTRRYETQYHFKLSSAVVSLIMMLMGASIALNTLKSGLAKRFGIALLFTFAYFMAMKLGITLGENGGLEPLLAAWVGHIIFGAISLLFYLRAITI